MLFQLSLAAQASQVQLYIPKEQEKAKKISSTIFPAFGTPYLF